MYICIRKFLDGMKHLFTLSLLGWLFCGCNGSEGFISQSSKEFAETISDSNVQLVDVRTPEEFAAGHIPGAVNMDVKGADFDDKAAILEAERPVAVYCRSGARSKTAAKRLVAKGFTVYELNNGFMNWDGPEEK